MNVKRTDEIRVKEQVTKHNINRGKNNKGLSVYTEFTLFCKPVKTKSIKLQLFFLPEV